jgi:hypothetical protein
MHIQRMPAQDASTAFVQTQRRTPRRRHCRSSTKAATTSMPQGHRRAAEIGQKGALRPPPARMPAQPSIANSWRRRDRAWAVRADREDLAAIGARSTASIRSSPKRPRSGGAESRRSGRSTRGAEALNAIVRPRRPDGRAGRGCCRPRRGAWVEPSGAACGVGSSRCGLRDDGCLRLVDELEPVGEGQVALRDDVVSDHAADICAVGWV